MQLVGIALLFLVVWFGFRERDASAISVFDLHAFVMVLGGCTSAVLVSSKTLTALRTVTCLREIIPGLRRHAHRTRQMEKEREQLVALWNDGKKSAAVELAEKSQNPIVKQMLDLILSRAPLEASEKVFAELRHNEIADMGPAAHNWEVLARLGPAFGMVGTITGMVTLFRNMSSDNLNIGAAMSMALVATLYGVAFGSGIAGPIGLYLNNLLDERLELLERCEQSVNGIVAVANQ